MRSSLIIGLFYCALISCNPISKEQKALDKALEAYQNTPDDITSKAFAQAYNSYIEVNGYSDPAVPGYMLEGARIAEKRQKLNTALSWYESYFTRYYGLPDAVDHYYEMVSLIEAFSKPELDQVYYKSLVKRFPSHPRAEEIKTKITDPSLSIDSSLHFVLKRIPTETADFTDSAETTDAADDTDSAGTTIQLKPEDIQLYIEMVEVSVMTDTSVYLGPEHLVKAAEVARIAKLYPRTIKLYDWVIRLYPNHRYSTSALFMKGYVTYFDLKDYEKANEIIKEYQAKDPYGQFEFEANYLVNNPGKSEAELIKAMEAQ